MRELLARMMIRCRAMQAFLLLCLTGNTDILKGRGNSTFSISDYTVSLNLSNGSLHGIGILKIHLHPDGYLIFCCCTVTHSSSITKDAVKLFGVLNGYVTTRTRFQPHIDNSLISIVHCLHQHIYLSIKRRVFLVLLVGEIDKKISGFTVCREYLGDISNF